MLYRGGVVEAGDVELVVKHPQHPYTQLLVGSIPLPRVERTWAADGGPAPAAPSPAFGTGCPFEDRCPAAMPACRRAAPPLFRTGPHRVVSCFLYEDSPTLPAHQMTTVFVEPRASSHVEPPSASTAP